MAVAGDTFTDSNGVALANHIASGPDGGWPWSVVWGGAGLVIQGNLLRSANTANTTVMRADVNLGNADQQVQFIVSSWNEGASRFNIGCIARKDSSATQTYYMAELRVDNGSHDVQIFRVVNNVFTELGTAPVTWLPGQTFRFILNGSTLQVYQHLTLRLEVTDSVITTGMRAGLFRNANSNATTVDIDGFGAFSLSTGIEMSGSLTGRGDIVGNAEVVSPNVIDLSGTLDGAGSITADVEAITPVLSIDRGTLVHQAVFNYIPASRAIQKLAEHANFWWFIDKDKRLWFKPKDALPALFPVSGNDMRLGTVQLEESGARYRNRQYIRGAKDITDELTNIVVGDGESRSFALGYPASVVSLIEVSLNGGAFVAKTLGIKGKDAAQWYWRQSDETIAQDDGETILTTVDRVRATFRGIVDIIVQVQDAVQIEQRRTLEGVGTGLVEWVDDEPTLSDRAGAFQWAGSWLQRYGQISRMLTFHTRRKGLRSGQLLTINLPDHGLLDRPMLIESVRVFDDEGQTWYEIHAVDGPEEGSWANFFSGMLTRSEENIIRENLSEDQILLLLKQFAEDWELEDEPNIFLTRTPHQALLPSAQLVPCFAFDDRLKFLEVETNAGQVMLRKPLAIREGLDTGAIRTMAFLQANDAVGDVVDFVWYGGDLATENAIGSGVEVGRRAENDAKTNLEAWQVEREDAKLFDDPVPTGITAESRITVTQLAKETGADGSQNTPAVNIEGADLGSVFDGLGRTWMLFGDTFSALNPLAGHRQNSLASTIDEVPGDGITFNNWVTDSNGDAKQLFASTIPKGPFTRATVLPALAVNSPGLRCFVLIPSDDPLPDGSIEVIQRRWNIGMNWLKDSILTGVKAFPDVVFLDMPFTAAQVLAASTDTDSLALRDLVFGWMESDTIWQPKTRPVLPQESWLVLVRGAGAFAGGLAEPLNSDHVGWGMGGDAMISAWLAEAGLEANRCTLILGSSFPCSADAQTGAAVHELMHGAFTAFHPAAGTDSIMLNWGDFPDVPIDTGNRNLIVGSPYVTGAVQAFVPDSRPRSAIPTHGVSVGNALYVYYQQPFFTSTGWEANLSSVQRSLSAGASWTRLKGLTWTRPSNFAQVAIYKESDQNLIFNGQFATGVVGWVQSIDAGITATTQRVDEPHDASAFGALEIDIAASTAPQDAQRYQDVRIDPTGKYLFSCKFLGASFSNAAGRLWVQWLDLNQALITSIFVSSSDVSGNWIELRMDNQSPPANAVYARITLSVEAHLVGGTGKAYFDKVEVRRTGRYIYFFGIPEGRSGGVALMRVLESQIESKSDYEYLLAVPSVNQAINGDFQHDLKHWELEVFAPEINGNIFWSPSEGIGGSGAMQMEINSVTGTPGSVLIRRAQQIPAQPGQIWNAQVKVKADLLQQCRIDFSLVWRDSGGAIISFAGLSSFDATDRYIPLSVEKQVAPAGTVALEIQLVLRALSTGATRTGRCWFDAVRVTRGQEVWEADDEHNAVLIVPPTMGEMSVAWNEYLQKFIMLGFMDGRNQMRVSDTLAGPWGPPIQLMTQAQFPCQYAPFTKDSYVDEGGRIVYFRMSRFCPGFNPYSTYWMKLEFDA